MWSAMRSVGIRGFGARVGAFVFVFAGLIPHQVVRGSADEFGLPLRRLDGIDSWFGVGALPSATLQSTFSLVGPDRTVIDWLSILVYVSWLPVGIFVMWFIVRARWDLYWSFAWSWFAVWYLSLVGFVLLPVEPPWMVPGLEVERTLAERMTEILNVDPNQVAAFPSLHVGMPAALAFQARVSGMRRLAAALFVFSVATAFAVVHLGEHYAIDTIAGVAIAWYAVRLTTGIRRRAQVREQLADVDGEPRLAA